MEELIREYGEEETVGMLKIIVENNTKILKLQSMLIMVLKSKEKKKERRRQEDREQRRREYEER